MKKVLLNSKKMRIFVSFTIYIIHCPLPPGLQQFNRQIEQEHFIRAVEG